MNCRAKGNPLPTITWEFQGLELSDIENRITKGAGGLLKIADVSLADMGTYKCTARNMYGIIQMRVFTLIVEGEIQDVVGSCRKHFHSGLCMCFSYMNRIHFLLHSSRRDLENHCIKYEARTLLKIFSYILDSGGYIRIMYCTYDQLLHRQ